MGWVRDILYGIFDFFRDLLGEIAEWFKQLIEDTRAWIKIWKHELRGVIAGWLENDWVFILIVAGAIALAFLFPKIKTWVGKLTIVALLKAAWEDVKLGFVDILDFIHIIELDTINTILKILWPEYRMAMTELSTAASGLMQELGESSAYFHAVFSVVHGIAIVEASFMGVDARISQLAVFEQASESLSRTSDKFNEYAYAPALMIADIIDEFYLPRAENIRIAQQGTIDEIRENRNRVVRVNTAMHDFEGRLQHFIDTTPEEMQEIITERLQPVADALADALYAMDTQIMPMLNGVIDALELQTQRQQTINDNVKARMDDPHAMLAQYELSGEEQQRKLRDYVSHLAGVNSSETEEALRPAADQSTSLFNSLLVQSAGEHQALPVLRLEPITTKPVSAYTSTPRSSWFVGEY